MKNKTLTIASVVLLAQLTSTLTLAGPTEVKTGRIRGWEAKVKRAGERGLLAAALLGGAGRLQAAEPTANTNLQPYVEGHSNIDIDLYFPHAWELNGGLSLKGGDVKSIIGGRIDLLSTQKIEEYDAHRFLTLTNLELSIDQKNGKITAEQISAAVYSYLLLDAGIRLNVGGFTYTTLPNGMILMKAGTVEALVDAGTKINNSPLALTVHVRGNATAVGIGQPGTSGYGDRANFAMPGADGELAAGFMIGNKDKTGIRVEGVAKGEGYVGYANGGGGIEYGQVAYGARIQAWTHVGKAGKTILSLTVDGGNEANGLAQYHRDPLNNQSTYGSTTLSVGR